MATKEARKRNGRAWHIVDYDQLFKAVASSRNSELEQVQYTQRHINANHQRPAAQRHITLMAALRQTAESFEQYLLVKWVYEELLDQSQAHCGAQRYLRGWVVDERLRPPTVKRIGQMLGIDEKRVQLALKKLEYHGLMEQRPLPRPEEADAGGDENRDGGGENADLDGDEGQVHPKCTSGAPQVHSPLKKGKKENRRPSASVKKPEKEKKLGLSAEEGQTEAAAAGAASAPTGKAKTPAHAGRQGQTETEGPTAEGQGPNGPQAGSEPAAETKSKPNAPSSPAATPPMAEEPTETDGGGDVKRAAANLDNLCDGSGQAFAWEVYRRLAMPFEFESPECKAQLASFASVYQSALLEVRLPTKRQRLWDAAMKHADELGRRFKRNPNAFTKGHPGPVFVKKLKGLIAKFRPG